MLPNSSPAFGISTDEMIQRINEMLKAMDRDTICAYYDVTKFFCENRKTRQLNKWFDD